MTEKDYIKDFEEMFDLGSKNDRNEQSEEYGYSSESDDDFETLAKEISGEIEELDDKGISIKGDVPEIVTKVSLESKSTEDDVFLDKDDNELEADVISKKFGEGLDKIEEDMQQGWDKKDKKIEEKVGERIRGGDQVEWSFNSPAPMWDSFYAQKRLLIQSHMIGAQVEYEKWLNEMSEARVDISSEIFDQELMVKQMEEVQQHRERMKFIAIRVNNQYFMFKKFEEMLRGFLAKVQYVKPQIKQEGFIMEHMQDVVLYLSRLDALHDSVIKVEKTLAGAFDVLSRKVTISMELSPAERQLRKEDYQNRKNNLSVAENKQEVNDDLDGFDDLPTGAKVEPGKVKVGAIKWEEI